MKIVAVLNQKGGAGKTTISINLADALKNDGHRVLLIDADPQASSRDWNGINQGKVLPVIGLDRETLPRDLKSIVGNYEWVIIDGAPRITNLIAAAVSVANMILIPVHPSPYDVWACSDLVELIKSKQKVAYGAPLAAFVISRKIKNTKLSNEVTRVLEDYELPVFRSSTTQRVVYPTSAAEGKTVFSAGNLDAIEEINSIKDELKKCLGESELNTLMEVEGSGN